MNHGDFGGFVQSGMKLGNGTETIDQLSNSHGRAVALFRFGSVRSRAPQSDYQALGSSRKKAFADDNPVSCEPRKIV